MKKKRIILFVLLLLLTGCTSRSGAMQARTAETQAAEIPTVETQESEILPVEIETDIPEILQEDLALYGPVLEKYAQALNEQWEGNQYVAAGLSNVITSNVGLFAAESLGCALLDLDADGNMELLIGSYDGASLFDAYRLKDGVPERLFMAVSTLGESAYLYEDLGFLWDEWTLCREDTGAFYMYHLVYQDWLVSGYFPVRMEEGALGVTEGLVYNSIVDEFNPWYRVDGYTLDYRLGEQVVPREDGEMVVYHHECARVSLSSLENSWLIADLLQ